MACAEWPAATLATPQAGLERLRGGLEQHERGDAEGGGDRDEVVDVAAAASAFDAGNRRDGHGVAQRGGTGCQLALGDTAGGAGSLDSTGDSIPGRTDFQRCWGHAYFVTWDPRFG